MMNPRKLIIRELNRLEAEAALLELLRTYAKTESGARLSEFGTAMLAAGKRAGIKQRDMAKILEITPGAVSQHYNR